MKPAYPLFSQVVLAEDFPEHNLQRGAIGTIVEHYPMPDPEEDGYSLEGFNLPNVTLEVSASKIMTLAQWQQEKSNPDHPHTQSLLQQLQHQPPQTE